MHRNLNPFSMPSCPQININWKRFFFLLFGGQGDLFKDKKQHEIFYGNLRKLFLKFVKI
ncbi:MAG: hypothetical protein Ct9H300mP23_10380 [Nitrospinota bacterium]|nr:MAG: hypothetical protein Ct9H300mP23_10380 [Nitrospinota bacterium]